MIKLLQAIWKGIKFVLLLIVSPAVITLFIHCFISLSPSYDYKIHNDREADYYLERFYKNLNNLEREEINSLVKKETNYSVEDVINGRESLTYRGFEALHNSKWGNDIKLNYLVSFSDDWWLAFKQHVWELFVFFAVSEIIMILIIRKWPRKASCPYQERSELAGFHITLRELLTPDDETLYEKLRGPHIPLSCSETREGIKLFINGRQAYAGFIFIHPNCSVSTYAQIAQLLDARARKSICSTNTSLPEDLFGSEEIKQAVISHLVAVNTKENIQEKKRIQVFSCQDHGVPTSAKFIEQLNAKPNIKDLFNQYFLDSRVESYSATVGVSPFTEDMFFGDYILYDGRVVLMYDYETRVLTLLVGNEIEQQFKQIFTIPLTALTLS